MNKLRHYIFINPNDIHNKNHNKLNIIKKMHKNNYKNNENIKYWFYDDIVKLLNNYDKELSELFTLINPIYPALLADIGRYIILYNFGGMYLDLKCIAKPEVYKLIHLTKKFRKNIEVIGWQHPTEKYRTRNGCIISLSKKYNFFNEVLLNIKKKLLEEKENNNSKNLVFSIGSKNYINLFKKYEKNKKVAKFPLHKKIIINNRKIYKMNFVRWQQTHEKLFLNKSIL